MTAPCWVVSELSRRRPQGRAEQPVSRGGLVSAHQFRPRAPRRNPAAGILVIAAVFGLGLVAPATSAALSQFRGASNDGSTRFLRDRRAAGQRRHRRLRRRLRALRGDDHPCLPGPDQRQRRLPAPFSTAPPATARRSSSTPTSTWSAATPTAQWTSTSAPAGRRPRSPRARSTATAPSTPSSTGASSDGSRVFFHTNEPLVSGDTDSSRTSTSAPGGRRPRSPRAR